MPTYEYRCKDCGNDLEVVQSFTDDPLTTCEACGGPLRKVFGNVGIAFKGSGFYKNDSRGKPSSTTSTSGDKADTKSSDTKSSDSGSSGSSDSSGGATKKDAPKPAAASSPAAT